MHKHHIIHIQRKLINLKLNILLTSLNFAKFIGETFSRLNLNSLAINKWISRDCYSKLKTQTIITN